MFLGLLIFSRGQMGSDSKIEKGGAFIMFAGCALLLWKCLR